MTIKTLVMDCETRPTEAWVWGLWDVNVALNQIATPGSIVSFAAKFVDKDEVEWCAVNMATYDEMIYAMWELLDEADEVVGWNSNSFDLKLFNAAFIKAGLPPPSPYKKIDLMRVVKKHAKFLSNKLDFISGELGVGHKLKHEGFDLWKKVMQNDKKAWTQFIDYNVQDVLLTERVYHKLRPWITEGVNRAAYHNDHVCPSCGSDNVHKRGIALTTTLKYQRFQCGECGSWSRAKLAEKQEKREQLVGLK